MISHRNTIESYGATQHTGEDYLLPIPTPISHFTDEENAA